MANGGGIPWKQCEERQKKDRKTAEPIKKVKYWALANRKRGFRIWAQGGPGLEAGQWGATLSQTVLKKT